MFFNMENYKLAKYKYLSPNGYTVWVFLIDITITGACRALLASGEIIDAHWTWFDYED